jgi:hypothetical protein
MEQAKRSMSDNLVSHPYRELMAEAQREREIVDSPEGLALKEAIFTAVFAYSEFLEQRGLIFESHDDYIRMKALKLVITHDYGRATGVAIVLKDGAIDRVYGNGANPCPFGLGPADILHKQRSDD